MTINPKCDKCRKELNEFGAIMFSPPDNENNVKKFHICNECYNKMLEEFI